MNAMESGVGVGGGGGGGTTIGVRTSRIKTHHELLHSRDFRCCCCVHVRMGTIAFAMVHVMMQMAMCAVFLTAILKPELLNEPKTTVLEATVDLDNGQMEIHKDTISQISSVVKASKRDLHFALMMSIFFSLVSMVMMFGAIWGTPSYILPFFCIMCFDFATAMLRLIGSFADRHIPRHDGGDPFNAFSLMLAVIIKAYLLNMVWSCYKYLRLRQELIRNPPALINGQSSMAPMAARPVVIEASHLLPDYEATQKYPYNFYPAPPPPYATATQMPTMEQVVAPPPSYQDVAGTSNQDTSSSPNASDPPTTDASSNPDQSSSSATVINNNNSSNKNEETK